MDRWTRLTVVNLLQRNLSVVWQGLLSLRAQQEGLWLLGCHVGVLGIHDGQKPSEGLT